MSRAQGPCLPHCYECSVWTVVLARMAIIYLIACVVYAVLTVCAGTPFKDSLTPEQEEIKSRSASSRSAAFGAGLVFATAAVLLWKPFVRLR